MLVSVLVIARILILGLCVAGLAGSPIGQTTNFVSARAALERAQTANKQAIRQNRSCVYIYI